MMRRVVIQLLILAFAAPSIADGARDQAPVHRAGPLAVRLWFDPPVGTVVDTPMLYVEIEIDDGWTVESAALSLALGDTLDSLTVTSIGPFMTVGVSENRFRRSQVIELAPDLPGAESVGPFRFEARNIVTGETVSLFTEPVAVEIQSLLADAVEEFEPAMVRGPLAPVAAPESRVGPVVFSGLVGGGIAIAIATYLMLRRRPRHESVAGAIARLHAHTSDLSNAGLSARDTAACADAFIRELLAIGVEPGALSMTSQEIVSALLEHETPKDVSAAATAFFAQIERVLFAGDSTGAVEQICDLADSAVRAVGEHTRQRVAAA